MNNPAATLAGQPAAHWLAAVQDLTLRHRHRDALVLTQAALTQFPDEADLCFAQAGLLLQLAEPDAAQARLNDLLRACPGHAGAALLLARLQYTAGRCQAMAATLRHWFTYAGADVELAIRAIELLESAGRLDDALAIGEDALTAHADDARLHMHAGSLLSQLGRFDAARQHLELALAQLPAALEWHAPLALAGLQKYTAGHPDLTLFQHLLKRPALSAHARSGLLFALGKAHDDVGDHAAAASLLREANALAKPQHPWPRKLWKRRIEAVLARRLTVPPPHAADWAPLFVVGMPRSGSTLLASLLARHPAICSRGELPWLPTLVSTLEPADKDFPAQLAQAAGQYANHLRQDDALAASARWFIDKQPRNYFDVDIVLAMFPQARFIHCVRDARDNALSIWMQSFQPGTQDFACDFADIGATIHGVWRVMAHWSRRFPHAIQTVRYEDLVARPQACLDGLQAWLDLPRYPLMQAPAPSGAISTASLWQARQPIHRQSVARWQPYQTHLPELLSLPDHGEPASTV